MSTQMRLRIRQEVELIQRFSGSYGKKFDEMIAQMNGPAATADNPDNRCLRLCIEAVNMVLSMQNNLAGVLDDLSRQNPQTAR